MSSRRNPALWIWKYFLKYSFTYNSIRWCNDSFCQSCNGCQHFIRRSRCSPLLSSSIIKRTGEIICKLIIVSRIHCIGQPIIIIARIGYTCKHLPGIYIGHNCRTGTRFQCKLGWCNFKRTDFPDKKTIWVNLTAFQSLILPFVKGNYILFV